MFQQRLAVGVRIQDLDLHVLPLMQLMAASARPWKPPVNIAHCADRHSLGSPKLHSTGPQAATRSSGGLCSPACGHHQWPSGCSDAGHQVRLLAHYHWLGFSPFEACVVICHVALMTRRKGQAALEGRRPLLSSLQAVCSQDRRHPLRKSLCIYRSPTMQGSSGPARI